MNVLFLLVSGYVSGWFLGKLVNIGVYKYYNRPKFKVGDILVPKNGAKLEKWEPQQKITARVDEVGELCYKLVYQMMGQDIAVDTRPFYAINISFKKESEEKKRPVLTLVKE